MNKAIFIALVLAAMTMVALGQVHAGDCKYTFAGGNTYDFSHVGTIEGTYNGQKVYMNLCQDLTEICTDGGTNICIPKSSTSMGSSDISFASYSSTAKPTTTFADGVNTMFYDNGAKQCYNMGNVSRKTSVKITCADKSDTTFAITEGSVICQFNLPIKLDCGSSGGLSGGAIFLIVFFSVLAGYFVIGFIVCKFILKKPGFVQAIPQYGFWCSLPGNYIAGCKFVVGKFTKKGDNSMSTTSDNYGSTEEV